jgi:DNA-binding CsgD family transcriptional regulator
LVSRDPHQKHRVRAIAEVLVSQGWSQFACSTRNTSYSVLVERPPSGTQRHRLSFGEFVVANLFACGLSSKEVGADLSMSATTARGALLRACKKLSVRSAQLPLLWHTLASAPVLHTTEDGTEQLHYELDVEVFAPSVLAASERALVGQVLLGRRNSEIARFRGVSTQTVANQLHIISGKLNVSSRGELAAYVLSTRGPAETLSSRMPKRFGVEDSRRAAWLVREETSHWIYKVGVQRRQLWRGFGAGVVASRAAAVGGQRLDHLRRDDFALGRSVFEAGDVRLRKPVGFAVEEEVAGAVGGRRPDAPVGAFEFDFDAFQAVAVAFDLRGVVGRAVHGARGHQRRAVVGEVAAEAFAAG